ncbi:hypothetical protein CJ030_MR2G027100 [Morella rubra]|uniref:Uncharacterized protein n=1 Tax=Morella rubra TaxID=262757 RepID=A0A6A1WCB6_9ROSI|nr:hypothetical protein CJ030_MR2G027100 [Morella rubra]
MADTKPSFPPVSFRGIGAIKRSTMEFTSRTHSVGQSKTDSTCQSLPTATSNAIHVPPPGRRRGSFQASKSPLPWQKKTFDASEHEVPSGPNPISN